MQVRAAALPPSAPVNSVSTPIPMRHSDIISSSCQQFRAEHEQPNQIRYLPQIMSMILGSTCVRRISNFLSCLGLPEIFCAQRNYPLLPPSEENLKLAREYSPILSTISEGQANSAQLNRAELRYELLPPQQDRNYFSLVYYLGFSKEQMPMPLMDRIYDLLRPVLYGSKRDWEAVQVDLDFVTREPIGISFETANYTNNVSSYQTMCAEDLHLPCKISRQSDGTWLKTVNQKNGSIQTCETANPFGTGGKHPCLTIVSWNGSLDLTSQVAQKPTLTTYRISNNDTQFLDVNTYRSEGMDLRMSWLADRKMGRFLMELPNRKLS